MNGAARTIHVDDPNMPPLYVLRNELGLRGPHIGLVRRAVTARIGPSAAGAV